MKTERDQQVADVAWHFNTAYRVTRTATLDLMSSFRDEDDLRQFREYVIESSCILAPFNPDGSSNHQSLNTLRTLVARGVDDAVAGIISEPNDILSSEPNTK